MAFTKKVNGLTVDDVKQLTNLDGHPLVARVLGELQHYKVEEVALDAERAAIEARLVRDTPQQLRADRERLDTTLPQALVDVQEQGRQAEYRYRDARGLAKTAIADALAPVHARAIRVFAEAIQNALAAGDEAKQLETLADRLQLTIGTVGGGAVDLVPRFYARLAEQVAHWRTCVREAGIDIE